MSEQESTLDEFIERDGKSTDESDTANISVGELQQLEKSPIESWQLVKLGEILSLEYGDNLPSGSREDGTIPVYGSNGQVDTHSEAAVDEPGIVLGRKGSIGEIKFSEIPFWPIDTTYYITSGETNQNLRFLHYLLDNIQLERLNAASAIPGLNRNDMYGLNAIVPSLDEQHKIGTVLYIVDQAIEKTEEIIDKKEKVKEGLIQDIFKYGVGTGGNYDTSTEEKEYDKTKYGTVPEGWEILPLDQIVPDDAPITYGIVKPGDHHPDGVPVVKVENIYNGGVEEEGLLHTAPEIHEKYRRAELTEGDLLFTIRGTVGRMAFVPESLEGANLTQDTARIQIRDADPRFIRYYFESPTPNNYFERNTKGQAVQGINLEDLREVPVHLPPEEVQNTIVDILDSHTDQIQKEREYLNQLQRVKNGLMQDLLSGTVRTTDTNITVPDEVAQHG